MADYNSQKTGQEVEDILDSVKDCAKLGTEADTSADNTLLGWVNGLRTALGVTTKTETSGLNTLFTIYQGLRRKGRIAIPRTFMSVSADAVEDDENDSTEQLVIAPKTMALSSATTENDGLATAMDVKNTLAEYVKKGENAGTADFAQDLTGVPEATSEEFTFRPSAGDKSIRDESAVIRRIKGNTSVWGQIADNPIFANGTSKWNRVNTTLSIDIDGSMKVKHDTDSSQGFLQKFDDRHIPSGHKILVVIDYKRSASTSKELLVYLRKESLTGFDIGWITVASSSRRTDGIIITTTEPSESIIIYPFIKGAVEDYTNIYSVNIFDLTQIFGAGNEPTTIEEFKKLYPESYYPYCEPEVRSMRATGIETIGFNEFDGTTEQGVLATDGSLIRLTNAKTSTLVPVISFEKYYIKDILVTPMVDTHTPASYAFYDSNETCVGSGIVVAISTEDRRSVTLTIPANASYMRVSFPSDAVGKTACINLSHSGVRDGGYEPYHKSVRMLPDIAKYFPEGMHGIGEVFDEINETSAIQRLGVRAYEDGDNDNAEVTTDGTNTVYVLAEPIVTPITEPLQLDYDVDDFGTERMLSDEPSSPFKADIVYQFNAEGRIRDNGRNIERLEEQMKSVITMEDVIAQLPTTIATATERVTVWPRDGKLVANVLVDVSRSSIDIANALSVVELVGGSSDMAFDDVWRIRFAGVSSVLNISPKVYWKDGQAPTFDTWAICDIELRRTPVGLIFGEWKIYR